MITEQLTQTFDSTDKIEMAAEVNACGYAVPQGSQQVNPEWGVVNND